MIRKISLLAVLLMIVFSPAGVQAQVVEIWSPAVNISQSGSSFSPSFVVDARGTIHIFWSDEFSDLMYARSVDGTWTSPQPVNLPFDTFVPRLFLGANNQIHAFWINEDGDFFYSRSTADDLGNAGAWSGSTFLSDSVIFFDAAVAPDGIVHLAYIRSEETESGPAGLYYRVTNAGATAWQQPVNIYVSRYFRSLSEDTANVQIAVSPASVGNQVYLAWDNQPLKSIFFARSTDGGASWNPPVEVASPLTRSSATTPYNIQVATLGNQVVLVYQDGQPTFSCTQAFQYSEDGGATWSSPQRIMEDVAGCALVNQLVESGDQYLLLMTVNRDQVLLTAWDGSRWSNSKQQSEMLRINDLATRSNLTLSCQQIQIDNQAVLNLVGCDLERNDIWWKERQLSDVESWFSQDTSWRPLETITIGGNEFPSIAITIDASDQVHAFWNQISDPILNLPGPAISYSRWEDQRVWANPITAQVSNQQIADQIATEYDPSRNNLLLAWKDGLKGEIYFSWAAANQAILPSAWSLPVRISLPSQAADAPSILQDPMGRIFIVYAVPINEGRGIYLASSTDGGLTWTEPALILDAAVLGFEMVNQPHLSITSPDQFHLIWTRYQFTAAQPQPIELYYGRSMDGGSTWNEISQVTGLPVFWSHIETNAPQTIHRFWQELEGDQVDIWHEVSLDNGQTWEKSRPFSLFGEKIGSPAIEKDSSGRIHLLQILKTNDNRLSLQHLVWENRWNTQQAKDLNLELVNSLGSPVITISPRGFLGVVFPVGIANTIDNRLDHQLVFTGQSLEDLPALETPAPPAGAVTPGAAETSEANAEQSITPDQPAVTRTFSPNPASAISPTVGILIGVFFSILVISAVVAYRLWHKPSA